MVPHQPSLSLTLAFLLLILVVGEALLDLGDLQWKGLGLTVGWTDPHTNTHQWTDKLPINPFSPHHLHSHLSNNLLTFPLLIHPTNHQLKTIPHPTPHTSHRVKTTPGLHYPALTILHTNHPTTPSISHPSPAHLVICTMLTQARPLKTINLVPPFLLLHHL